jgi:hypothetical protein
MGDGARQPRPGLGSGLSAAAAVLSIGPVERGIEPGFPDQRGVIAEFDEFAVADHGDAIGVADGGQTMRDDNGGAALAQAAQGPLNPLFGLYVDR